MLSQIDAVPPWQAKSQVPIGNYWLCLLLIIASYIIFIFYFPVLFLPGNLKLQQCKTKTSIGATIQSRIRAGVGPVWEREIHYRAEMNHNSFKGDLGPGGGWGRRGRAAIAEQSHWIEGLSGANQRGSWMLGQCDGTRWVQHQHWRISVRDVKSRCQFDVSWVRGEEKGAGGGAQSRVWLFTPGCLLLTSWFQAEGLIIWRGLRSALTMRSYSSPLLSKCAVEFMKKKNAKWPAFACSFFSAKTFNSSPFKHEFSR